MYRLWDYGNTPKNISRDRPEYIMDVLHFDTFKTVDRNHLLKICYEKKKKLKIFILIG